jgi:hypothetical protein
VLIGIFLFQMDIISPLRCRAGVYLRPVAGLQHGDRGWQGDKPSAVQRRHSRIIAAKRPGPGSMCPDPPDRMLGIVEHEPSGCKIAGTVAPPHILIGGRRNKPGHDHTLSLQFKIYNTNAPKS